MPLEPFVSQIQIFAFNFAPRNWAQCNGQLLPISQNQALFSLLGTTYGGNGTVNFALPDFRGRTPMHIGNGFTQGQSGGAAAHTLTVAEMPAHTHQLVASSVTANANTPANNYFPSNSGFGVYAASFNATTAPNSISNTGGSQAHNNMSPYLTLNICIALAGVFPSRP